MRWTSPAGPFGFPGNSGHRLPPRTELTEEFFADRRRAKMTRTTSTSRYGRTVHHMIEAAFAGFARALWVAVSIDPEKGAQHQGHAERLSRDKGLPWPLSQKSPSSIGDGQPPFGREGLPFGQQRGHNRG